MAGNYCASGFSAVAVFTEMNERTPKIVAATAGIWFLTKPGFCCMVCVSNLSYNALRFGPAWIILLIIWTLILTVVYSILKKKDVSIIIWRRCLKPALVYLGAIVFLYLIGLHFVAILFLPFLFVRIITMKPKQDAGIEIPKDILKRLKIAGWLFFGLLLISVFVSFNIMPRVISEPGTRSRVQLTKSRMKAIHMNGDYKMNGDSNIDSFAYKTFDVPVLNMVVQGFGFFRKISDRQSHFRYHKAGNWNLLWSRGPDGRFDISTATATLATDMKSPNAKLNDLLYDPTNGILSAGDILAVDENTSGSVSQ